MSGRSGEALSGGNHDGSFFRRAHVILISAGPRKPSIPPLAPSTPRQSVTRQLQLVLQLLKFLLGFLVVKELVHRLLHILGAVINRLQVVSVFRGEVETILILTKVNDGRLGAGRQLLRVSSHLADGLSLPGMHGVAYLLQLGGAFSHCIGMALDSVQIEGMAFPVTLGGFQA